MRAREASRGFIQGGMPGQCVWKGSSCRRGGQSVWTLVVLPWRFRSDSSESDTVTKTRPHVDRPE